MQNERVTVSHSYGSVAHVLDWKISLLKRFRPERRIGAGLSLCYRHQLLISGGTPVDQVKRYKQGVMSKASEDRWWCTT